MGTSVRVKAAGMTDAGRLRPVNQDYVLIGPNKDIFLVADGMGGHTMGEVASRIAAQYIVAQLQFPAAGGAAESVIEAVRRANSAVYQINYARDYAPGTGMGTTLAGVWLPAGGEAVIFHVGDCRVYRYRRGELERLTRDHSLHQAWKDGGQLGPEPTRNFVLRAIGPWDHVDPEVSVQTLQPGDTLLICSDGLFGMLSDSEIGAILGEADGISLERASARLIEAANQRGGRDNISVLLVSAVR